jgi:hypothetical protein
LPTEGNVTSLLLASDPRARWENLNTKGQKLMKL